MNLFFSDISLFLPLAVLLCGSTVLFFIQGGLNTFEFATQNSVLSHLNILKNFNYWLLPKYLFMVLSYLLITLVSLRGFESKVWWDNFNYTNQTVYWLLLFYVLFYFLFYLISSLNLHFTCRFNDFVYSFILVFFISFFILLSANYLTFLFALELISCTLLYTFIISRELGSYPSNLIIRTYNPLRVNSSSHVTALFFQYWSVFFSTALALYFLIIFIFTFGSSDWTFSSSLAASHKNSIWCVSYSIIFAFFGLFLSFMFKMGVAPLHLFKPGIYEGLPLLVIFIYTVVYFIVFLAYFIFLFIIHFYNLYLLLLPAVALILLIGSFLLVITMFSINSLKPFLAYSGIINTYIFILLTFLYCA